MGEYVMSKKIPEKEISEILAALYGKQKEKKWYDIAYAIAKSLGMTDGELAACGLALLLTHGPGYILKEKRVELHKKIDKELFGIEEPVK
jgi:hypothetical protein